MNDAARVNLFADDIALYREIKCSSDYQLLQAHIDKIVFCICSKYLFLNSSECCYMLVTCKSIQLRK